MAQVYKVQFMDDEGKLRWKTTRDSSSAPAPKSANSGKEKQGKSEPDPPKADKSLSGLNAELESEGCPRELKELTFAQRKAREK